MHAEFSKCDMLNKALLSQYFMVATSELVVNLGGPDICVGSLGTTRLAVKMKTVITSFFFMACNRLGTRT